MHKQEEIKEGGNSNSNSNKANVVEKKSEGIVAMNSQQSVFMTSEANMVAIRKISNWWLHYGATIYVYNDRSLYSAYKEDEDGNFILMRNQLRNHSPTLKKVYNYQIQFIVILVNTMEFGQKEEKDISLMIVLIIHMCIS